MRTRRATLWLGIAALLALQSTALGASSLPRLLTGVGGGRQFTVRPAEIVYTGDGSGELGGFDGNGRTRFGHLHWSTWTRRGAEGSGAVWIDNCTPNCAQGRFSPHAVTVHAFAPRSARFTRLTLRYRYRGKAIVDRRAIVKFGGFYSYSIVGAG